MPASDLQTGGQREKNVQPNSRFQPQPKGEDAKRLLFGKIFFLQSFKDLKIRHLV